MNVNDPISKTLIDRLNKQEEVVMEKDEWQVVESYLLAGDDRGEYAVRHEPPRTVVVKKVN
jgi:hypothetical protein